MQPEEIIQQKEWHQLTIEEKQALQSLVADEQEYNLLKKMMMIADETAADVPQIDPALQQKLHRSVKNGTRKWYYAAAAVLLVAVSAWFFLRNEKENMPDIVINNPEKKEVITKDTMAVRIKETPIEPPAPEEEKINTTYAAISTLVKDDSELMAFVTEVY